MGGCEIQFLIRRVNVNFSEKMPFEQGQEGK